MDDLIIENFPNVNAERQEWRDWAQKLSHWGLAGLASALLESGGVFTEMAAQGLYVGQPLLDTWMPVRSLVALLEDPKQTQAFIKVLQEESK